MSTLHESTLPKDWKCLGSRPSRWQHQCQIWISNRSQGLFQLRCGEVPSIFDDEPNTLLQGAQQQMETGLGRALYIYMYIYILFFVIVIVRKGETRTRTRMHTHVVVQRCAVPSPTPHPPPQGISPPPTGLACGLLGFGGLWFSV